VSPKTQKTQQFRPHVAARHHARNLSSRCQTVSYVVRAEESLGAAERGGKPEEGDDRAVYLPHCLQSLRTSLDVQPGGDLDQRG
jgi:hypothetical protein